MKSKKVSAPRMDRNKITKRAAPKPKPAAQLNLKGSLFKLGECVYMGRKYAVITIRCPMPASMVLKADFRDELAMANLVSFCRSFGTSYDVTHEIIGSKKR